jgi:hypothetical protein
MKWIAISGGWRAIDARVEKDVRQTVRKILDRNDGIITGGALGVDFIATDEALRADPSGTHLRVFLPTPLTQYEAHYRARATEGVISPAQAETLIAQLQTVAGTPGHSLVEKTASRPPAPIDQTAYYARNTDIVNAADELVAFHINGTQGTQDAIDKARARKIKVTTLTYEVTGGVPKA